MFIHYKTDYILRSIPEIIIEYFVYQNKNYPLSVDDKNIHVLFL